MRISHSRVELYTQCPRKYQIKYIEKLEPNKTFTPLLFGSAIDKALNYVLTRTKRKHVVYEDTAKAIFLKNMQKWAGQNELIFFKNEMPDIMEEGLDPQWAVWEHLCGVGIAMIQTYIEEILPLFKEILSVQTKKLIPNEEGDELILITDFMAKLHDDRVVVFDNKTSTDVKKGYPKSSVAKSQQLAIYAEFSNTKLAGYVALQKKLKDGKVVWAMIIDEIPEEQTAKAFDKIDEALRGIKNEIFPPCPKSCFSFGRSCEYWNYCKRGDKTGLIQKK